MINSIIFDKRMGFQSRLLSSDIDKFESLLERSTKILLKTSSVFPFDFFPDEITIDEFKVNIIFHEFWLSGDIHSIQIDMIKDIEVESEPIFAELKIVPDGYPGHPLAVRFLKKKDAMKARRIIQGLMVARKQGIDPSQLDEHMIEKIERLGKTNLRE